MLVRVFKKKLIKFFVVISCMFMIITEKPVFAQVPIYEIDEVKYKISAHSAYVTDWNDLRRDTIFTVPSEVFVNEKKINVVGIDRRTFNNCKNLRHIILPNTVKWVGSYAFANSSLTTIVLSDSIKRINEGAFYGCEFLREIELPKSLKYIGDYFFGNCKSLKNISLPDSIESIGEMSFLNCYGLNRMILPKLTKTIKESAFGWCINLSEVIFPDSICAIEKKAFVGCSNLKRVRISKKCIIEESAFPLETLIERY